MAAKLPPAGTEAFATLILPTRAAVAAAPLLGAGSDGQSMSRENVTVTGT